MAELTKTVGDVKVRYDWYQTEQLVVVTILRRQLDPTKVLIEYKDRKYVLHTYTLLNMDSEPRRLCLAFFDPSVFKLCDWASNCHGHSKSFGQLSVRLPDLEEALVLELSHDINGSAIQTKTTPSKVEIKLPKLVGIQWNKLEGEDPMVGKPIPTGESEASAGPLRPQKNWDALVKAEPEEEGDPLNDLFKKIYNEGSDEVKKAMNKSFMESSGTVLSTNWGEVGAGHVEIKPPEGVELKPWDK